MIAKNGIDWDTMGFTVYGECPKYGEGVCYKKSKNKRNTDRNITFLPSHRLWQRIIQIDRGNELPNLKDNLCEEWKEYENFEKWYNENYYDVEGEKVEFSYRFFDVMNTYISPEMCCFLPHDLNKLVCHLHQAKNGLIINVDEKNGTYKIKMFGSEIAFSDSKEEIFEIRKQILKRQLIDFAEKYEKELPEKIYSRLLLEDFV